jgi:hypothetical protein
MGITQVRHKWGVFFLKHFYWNEDNAILHVRRGLVFCKVTSSQRKTCNYRFQLTWITYKVNTVIWGGLVIRGPRYELHLTRFWKCLAGADFIKDLIWRVQLLNAHVFFSCSLLAPWKILLFISYGIFQVLIPFMFSV